MGKDRCNNKCREWIGELTDDSTKQAFMSLEALQNGNPARALAYLKSQYEERLPLLQQVAVKECGEIKHNPTKLIQADLEKIASAIEKNESVKAVSRKVYAFDKKWALEGYYNFCKCNK